MIETLYSHDALDTRVAFLAALAIGFAFGFALERGGFGSSRRLAGIFYFRDMSVLKVMFSALVTAMLGLLYCERLGWLTEGQVHRLPSIYGAQVVGGLLFGVGFVVGGWCPGTAAVGAASGRIDALLFLGGAVGGSVLFNEAYGLVEPLQRWGSSGVQLAPVSLGISTSAFALLLTLAAVGGFWGSEWVERRSGGGTYLGSPFLKAFSLALGIAAAGLFVLPEGRGAVPAGIPAAQQEEEILAAVEAGADHVAPDELADRLMAAEPGLVVVDVRSAAEFETFHIRGAMHAPLSDLATRLQPLRGGTIVLYSNGMTHPAQARDALVRQGFREVFILTDGLNGFFRTCLKPVSLRSEPITAAQAARVEAWRRYFLGDHEPPAGAAERAAASAAAPGDPAVPPLVEPAWLAERLDHRDLCVIDCRPQPDYNRSHIPGSVCLSPESVRGVVQGVSSMLLPVEVLAGIARSMGIGAGDTVVFVPGDRLHDATLIAVAFERLGHRHLAVLEGGFAAWVAERRALTTVLPERPARSYAAVPGADGFLVDRAQVLAAVKARTAILIDTRPADFFAGTKSDEARAGRIPGAVNRPITEDLAPGATGPRLKPGDELERAYAALIPAKDARVIVYCRTGHQASQTFFVLREILGYKDVRYYDGSWSEWSAHPELPLEAAPAR
jgi:thiosulfate/3-mercaptopyruvate sulfurtransferase